MTCLFKYFTPAMPDESCSIALGWRSEGKNREIDARRQNKQMRFPITASFSSEEGEAVSDLI